MRASPYMKMINTSTMKFVPISLLLLLAVISTLLFDTCVDPVVFSRDQNADLLVVDGKVNLQDSVQTLLLTHTSVVGRSARFPPEIGAQVSLFENDQQVAQYTETGEGVYTISNFRPQVGKAYHIDIQLSNGERYTSQPEVMPQDVPLDSAYFKYEGGRSLTIFARTFVPAQGEVPYLRWRINHVYQITDLICGGLDKGTTCYYNAPRATDNQLVPLLDGSELTRGASVESAIVEVPIIDSLFGEVSYFTVFQESMPAEAFQYWEKVNTLLTQTGSLFDIPPGQIRGNIFKVDDPEAPVLGVFYPASENHAYVKTVPTDFPPLQLRPYCGFPGFPPFPFPYPQCCYCRYGIDRPDYW